MKKNVALLIAMILCLFACCALEGTPLKIVIAMDCDLISDVEGIKIVKELDFLNAK